MAYIDDKLTRLNFYNLDVGEEYDRVSSCIDYWIVKDEQKELLAYLNGAGYEPRLEFAHALITKYYYAQNNEYPKLAALRFGNYDWDVKYRCVEIELTKEQIEKLTPMYCGKIDDVGYTEDVYEFIDHCWLKGVLDD